MTYLERGVNLIKHKKKKEKLSLRIKKELKKNWFVYIVLGPILLHFLVFQIIPFIFSFVLTFLDYRIIGKSEFVGLKHWKYIFQDPTAWIALKNTFIFSLYYIIPTMALGLILALIINSGIKGTKFIKGIFFLPVVTSFVVVASLWAWIFNGTDAGLINNILGFFNIEPQLFLSSSKQAMLVLAGLSIFKVAGNTMIYYYAGLQSIDTQVYEAAKIDGASKMKTFWKITFPLLKPIHFYVLITTTIGALQIFDSPFLLTSGGPNYTTTTLVYYMYEQGFRGLNLSYASVISYVLFIIILAISLVQKKFLEE